MSLGLRNVCWKTCFGASDVCEHVIVAMLVFFSVLEATGNAGDNNIVRKTYSIMDLTKKPFVRDK